jgi:hypothetical protein
MGDQSATARPMPILHIEMSGRVVLSKIKAA